MQSVLLASLGSPGDINPFIALSIALKKEGIRPLFLANPYDAPAVEMHGIETLPVGESWDLMSLVASDPKYLLSTQAGLHTTRDIFIPYSTTLFPAAMSAIEIHRPAAVVAHPFCYGATWAANRSSVPVAVAHLSPLSLMTKDVFDVYPVIKRFLFNLAMPMGKAQFNKLVQPLCRELGVPWHKAIIEESMLYQDILFGMWSERFAALPFMSAQPGRVTCGYPILGGGSNASSSLDASLREFMDSGDPPVAVTLGTNAFAFAGDFFDVAIEATKRLGLRAVIVSKIETAFELPDTARVVKWVDYDALFPRCRAVIHHGGAGVTAQTLRAGVPAIVVPFGHDQEDSGFRVEKLGTGRLVPRTKIAKLLRVALSDVLSSSVAAQAALVGEQIRRETDGAETAARYLAERLSRETTDAISPVKSALFD